MPTVRFTQHLKRFFPDLEETAVPAGTVAGVVSALEERYPGLGAYLVDERGSLRQHVNVFVNRTNVRDRRTLTDAVGEDDTVFVFQALSGG